MGFERVIINLKRGTMVISEGEDTVFTFDWEGRVLWAYIEGKNFRRSLDNRIITKVREDGKRLYIELTQGEKGEILDFVYTTANEILSFYEKKPHSVKFILEREEDGIYKDYVIGRIKKTDKNTLKEDAEEFYRIYKSVGILPPDRYLSLYIQLTEGCHWNRCSFCNFYKTVSFRIRPPEELKAHIEDIKRYFGEGLRLRRTIFLGDANSFVIPQDELLERFRIIHDSLGYLGYGREIYSFIDVFTGIKKKQKDFEVLRDIGLRRVYVGVESGSKELLKSLNKPEDPQQALDLVKILKTAGIDVGIIVLVGAGEKTFSTQHIEETVRLVKRMPLGSGDILYLSEFVGDNSSYTVEEIERERETMKKLLCSYSINRGFKIATYDIREFVY